MRPPSCGTSKRGRRFARSRDTQAGVLSAALSPDGKTVLTGSFDKTAMLFDAETGKKLRTFREHSKYSCILSVAFSPDGETVLTGSKDKTAVPVGYANRQNPANVRGTFEVGQFGRLQPRRQDDFDRIRRRDGRPVGRGHGPHDPNVRGALGPGRVRQVQPRRQNRPDRIRRRDGNSLERRNRRKAPGFQTQRGRSLYPSTSAPTARPYSPAVETARQSTGTRKPAGSSKRSKGIRRAYGRRLSVPTAEPCSPPPATTRRSIGT